MFGKSRTKEVRARAEDGAVLARELASDKKFRRELTEAFGHGRAAKQRATSRIGTIATLRRLADDDELRSELNEMATNLRRAKQRLEDKGAMKRKRGHKLRNAFLLGGAALVALPQTRGWLQGLLGGPRVVSETITVDVPATTAYNQWTQFEDFPKFMEGVEEVRQLDDTRLRWVASVAGKRAEWQAKILEQHPDSQVSWVSEDGKATRGTVSFEELAPERTRVELSLSYRAQGLREAVGSMLGLDARRVRGDLERFKQMIEARGTETGAWRGEIHAGTTQ